MTAESFTESTPIHCQSEQKLASGPGDPTVRKQAARRQARGHAPEPPLRILAVGNMYPPQHVGGYELVWQQAMCQARRAGHRVRILTTDHYEDRGRAEQDPDVYRTLRWYWDLSRYQYPRLNFLQRLALERHNSRQLRRHLAAFRPDVVAWWSMGCMSLSLIEQVRRKGVPAVFVVHDNWLVYGWEVDQWLRTWEGPRRGRLAPVAASLCRIPTRVDVCAAGPLVFNSRYTMQRAREAGFRDAAMRVVYPGIDQSQLEPLPPQPWRWRLAYVGRIDRQKGIDTAVEALARLPAAATLSVWGSGDERYIAELRKLAARLGVAERLRFAGFAAGKAVRAAYGNADVVVFPVRWNEPFGLVPLEAMACARPLVTTARGGTVEFVREGVNALVFEAGDSEGLARAIRRLQADEALRARLVEEGRRTAARFSAARFAERTVREIVRAARPRAGA
jgi:glycogen(starch) synthase